MSKEAPQPAVLKAVLEEATPTPSFARFDRQVVYSPEPTFEEWTSRHIPNTFATSSTESSRFRSAPDPESAFRAAAAKNAAGFQVGSTFPFRHEFLPSTDLPDSPFIKSSRPDFKTGKRPSNPASTSRPNSIKTDGASKQQQQQQSGESKNAFFDHLKIVPSCHVHSFRADYNSGRGYTAPVAPPPTASSARPTSKQPPKKTSPSIYDSVSPSAAPVDNWLLLAKDPDMLNNIVGSAQQYANLKTNGKFRLHVRFI